jgi:hypothetical protein
MELRTIAEPKIKSPKSALLCHSFAIPGQLSTQPAWLYFSNLDTLNAYMLAAPALIGRSFAIEVAIKSEKVGNREYSWNTLKPKWGLGFMDAAGARQPVQSLLTEQLP